MTRPFMPLNDFINLMSQMLLLRVPVTCHLSKTAVSMKCFALVGLVDVGNGVQTQAK